MNMKKILVFLTLLASIVGLFTACQNSSEPEVRVLIWSDYIKPGLIEKFKKAYNCRVIVDTFDSNESMYAKLKLGAGGYDLIFPSNYFMDIMSQQGMLKPLDTTLVPNIKNLDQQYVKRADPALLHYGIPYMVSSAGIAYRLDKVESFDPSWGIFGKPEYKGRMTMLNDVRETMGAALNYLGYSSNTTSQEEVDQATNLLIEWKQNLAKFESEQYKSGIASAEYLIVNGYNGDLLQVIRENPEVTFVYPKEGVTIVMDFMVMPKDAPNPEYAYKFMNFLLDAEVTAENMEFTLFFSPNRAAYDQLPKQLRENQILFLPEKVLEKAELIRYLGEEGIMYNKAWDKIKAA